MKTMNWKHWWLAGLLVAGCAGLYLVPLRAAGQGDPAAATAQAVSSGTNSAEAGEESNTTTHRQRGPVVVIGGTAELKAGDIADAVVAIGGSAKAKGRVRDSVVAIAGNAEADGEVGDAVVAVMGNVKIGPKARVHGDVVSVIGKVDVAEGANVGDQVVAVLGNVKIGPNARVRGDVVSVFGKVDVADGAKVDGQIVPVLGLLGIGDWVEHCALKFRLLAPQVKWVWVVTVVFLLIYLLIALLFPKPVAACVNELTERPATTFLLGLLTKLLIPLVILVLAVTGIGVFVVPFILAAVWFGAFLGKAALLQYLGRQLARVFGASETHPLIALVIGWILLTLLYLIPILSLLVFAVTGMWGLGAAVTAMFGGTRREMPDRPAASPAPPPPVIPTPVAGLAPIQVTGTPPASNVTGATLVTAAPPAIPPATSGFGGTAPPTLPTHSHPPVIGSEALLFPRAGFWERMAAAFLDVVLVSILSAVVGGPPWGFLVALAYFAGMWTWRGTTIGGIVLNLKVVRMDGQPVTFVVALVRGLAAAFSVVVLFLGFLWIAWDRDKQGWHDKIAGTAVIRLPRGMPLVCL